MALHPPFRTGSPCLTDGCVISWLSCLWAGCNSGATTLSISLRLNLLKPRVGWISSPPYCVSLAPLPLLPEEIPSINDRTGSPCKEPNPGQCSWCFLGDIGWRIGIPPRRKALGPRPWHLSKGHLAYCLVHAKDINLFNECQRVFP